jgi:hypothetical protein
VSVFVKTETNSRSQLGEAQKDLLLWRLVDTSTPRTWSISTPLKKIHFYRFCGDTQRCDFGPLEEKKYFSVLLQIFTSLCTDKDLGGCKLFYKVQNILINI